MQLINAKEVAYRTTIIVNAGNEPKLPTKRFTDEYTFVRNNSSQSRNHGWHETVGFESLCPFLRGGRDLESFFWNFQATTVHVCWSTGPPLPMMVISHMAPWRMGIQRYNSLTENIGKFLLKSMFFPQSATIRTMVGPDTRSLSVFQFFVTN